MKRIIIGIIFSLFMVGLVHADSYDCNNAWNGSPGDHAEYYCQAACGYANAGHDEGVTSNCDLLRQISQEAYDNCPLCSSYSSSGPADDDDGDDGDDGDDSGCFVDTIY